MEAAAGTSSSQPGFMSYKDALVINQHQQVRNVNTSKSSRNLISTNQNSKTANAVAEVPAAKKKMDFANVTTSPGNPAEYIIIIIIIVIIIISFMQGIYTYIPETNYVPR